LLARENGKKRKKRVKIRKKRPMQPPVAQFQGENACLQPPEVVRSHCKEGKPGGAAKRGRRLRPPENGPV
jgi:hypothetical protein